jgi:diguanylate cyclase (GGDEF)-like protein/PAS domain S-box-containing protein
MGTRRLSRLLLASARRVAPGGESGWWRWSVPALSLLLVVYVAMSVISADGRASHAAAAAGRARDLETATAAANVAQSSGWVAGLRDPQSRAELRRTVASMQRAYTGLVRTLPDDAEVADAGRAAAAAVVAPRRVLVRGRVAGALGRSPAGPAFARATAAAGAIATRLQQASDRATASAQRALSLTLIGGGLLAALLLWSSWAKRTRFALERSERRYRSLIERSSELVFIVDENQRVRFVTPVAERRLGYAREALLGRPLADLAHPDDRERVDVGREGAARERWRLRRSDGAWVDVEAEWVDMRDDLAVRGYVVTVRDVAERVALEEQIRHQAFHDSLTGLANRALFEDRVRHALERFRRDSERSAAVLFVDLDDFKTVNDSLGHASGDDLLRQVALRLGDCTRNADTVARLGGDEFAVLVEGAYAVATASVLADRIQAALEDPIVVGEQELFVHASIGIAGGELESTAADLLRNADIAMYSAKANGKSRTVAFEPKMGMSARKRHQLSRDLRRALGAGELSVKYQPLIRLTDRRMLGVEALLRWRHPTLGELPPVEFIPLAEETGLIVPIGGFVLSEACRQLGEWQADHPGNHPDYVSVNVSARQFQRHGDVLEQIEAATRAAGLDPSTLMIELTETVLMRDHKAIVRELEAIRALGVRIAIDDFGTGYSALSYLKRFPIDTVKMDRSFVQNLGAGKADAALIRSVVELGEALDMQIIAEGIEGQHQLDSVTGVRCDMGQGYFFSPPLPAHDIDQMLREEDAAEPAGHLPSAS